MPFYSRKDCGFCGGCAGVCPKNAITVYEKDLDINLLLCIKCNKCVQVCPSEALINE